MKVFKRNAVIVTVLVFVCAAVYLNWSYAKTEVSAGLNKPEEQESHDKSVTDTEEAEESGLYYVQDGSEGAASETAAPGSEYFDQVRLSREQARDSAGTALKTVTETPGAAQSAIDEAMAAMVNMAKRTEEEARLESLVIAKGFSDCVAYMTDEGITVTVPADSSGLSESAVARIKDIVLSETAYSADQLKIIEIK